MPFKRMPFLMEEPEAGKSPSPAPAAPSPEPDPVTPTTPDDPEPKGGRDEIAILKAKLDKAITAEKNARERAQKAEAAAAEIDRKEAEKRGEFEKLYGTEKQRADDAAKRVADLEAVVADAVAAELETVPEQFRDLIPDGTDAQKLAWVRKSKAKGLFAAPADPKSQAAPRQSAPPPTAPKPGGSPSGMLSPSDEARLAQMLGSPKASPQQKAEARQKLAAHNAAKQGR